jgi:hypothetical protein
VTGRTSLSLSDEAPMKQIGLRGTIRTSLSLSDEEPMKQIGLRGTIRTSIVLIDETDPNDQDDRFTIDFTPKICYDVRTTINTNRNRWNEKIREILKIRVLCLFQKPAD